MIFAMYPYPLYFLRRLIYPLDIISYIRIFLHTTITQLTRYRKTCTMRKQGGTLPVIKRTTNKETVYEAMSAKDTRNGNVYITGDKHCSFRPFFGLRDKGLIQENDILIITGDAGYVWDEEYMTKIRTLEQLFSGTLAFIDGNHENHSILNRLPVSFWHGGRVHRISDRVFHLMRGEIYEIGGARYFAFGGARTVSRYVEGVEGIDWWTGEEPSPEEIDHGRRQIAAHLPDIDYVITHEAPLQARDRISRVKRIDPDYMLPSILQDWYEKLADAGRLKQWYFGHMHVDQQITPDLRAIHNNILRVGTETKLDWS